MTSDPSTAVRARPTGLTGFLDSDTLIGPGSSRSRFDAKAKLRLLIVYDVSGSMLDNSGLIFTRTALGDFLDSLPTSIDVALVPFESRGVKQAFTDARFGGPRSVREKLANLPKPRTNGNTALYSAIAEGLRFLDQPAALNSRSVLLVLTDGFNDVGHHVGEKDGDDEGLLADPDGREAVRGLIAASPHLVWLVGAGAGVRSGVLDTLAGSNGRVRTVEMKLDSLQGVLSDIRIEIMTGRSRSMVYGLRPPTQAALGRYSRWFRFAGLADSVRPWRPLLVALPPFEGVVDDSASVPDELATKIGRAASDTSSRLSIAIPALAILLLAYFALPRRVGAPAKPADADNPIPQSPTPRTVHATVVPPVYAQADAPPRKPSDITRDGAM